MKYREFIFFAIVVLSFILGLPGLQGTSAADFQSQSLRLLWNIQRNGLRDSKVSLLTNESSRNDIEEYLLDNGIQRSSMLAAAYASEATSLLAKNKVHKAVWAYESALRMDPVFVPAARGLLISSLRKGISAFLMALPTFIGAYLAAYQDPWTLLYSSGNVSMYLIITILGGFIGIVDAWDLPPGTAFFQIRDPQKIKIAFLFFKVNCSIKISNK